MHKFIELFINNSQNEDLINYINENNIDINKLFIYSCKKGYLTIIRYIYSIFLNNNGNHHLNLLNKAYNISIKYGHVHVIKWLKSIGVVSPMNNTDMFIISCINGHLNIVSWLYNTYNDINISEHIDQLFIILCQVGKLEIIKWLNKIVNMCNINYNIAFNVACKYGNLDIAKYLLSFDIIDIRFGDDYAFKSSCRYNYINIAKWLKSMCNDYDLEIENNTIKYYSIN
jgi:ankyrin repeat protein